MLERGKKDESHNSNLIVYPGGRGEERFFFGGVLGRFLVGGAIGYTYTGLIGDASDLIVSNLVGISKGYLDATDLMHFGEADLNAIPYKLATGLFLGAFAAAMPKTTGALLDATDNTLKSWFKK